MPVRREKNVLKKAVELTNREKRNSPKGLHDEIVQPFAVQGNSASSSAVSASVIPANAIDLDGDNENETVNQGVNNDFIEVRSKKYKKQQRRSEGKKSMFITGRAVVTNDKLKVVEKRKHMFVSRFAEDVECDALRQYLNDYAVCNYEVIKLKNRYPGYSSFKVGVPLSLWDKMYDPDFWPTGTEVKTATHLMSRVVGVNNVTTHTTYYYCTLGR
ncbi:hypothetical protein J6590_045293 [Homalodisca vitripennis]|nr:hypothetical protein J6590_045293 [Homalodisca vitripennis]